LAADAQANPTRKWATPGGKPTAVKIDPFNPQVMFLADWWGAYKSTDGGLSWHEKIRGAPNSSGSDVHVSADGRLYVATMDNGLLASADGGKSYTPLAPSLGYRKEINGHIWRVRTAGERGNTVVATSSPWGEQPNQVLLSTDGGATFAIVRDGLPATRPKANTMWGTGYARALAIDPSDPQRMYLGIDGDDGGGLFVSVNGGRSWQRSPGQPGSLRIYNGLAVDPTSPNRVFWGACGQGAGVYRSDDRGAHWTPVLTKIGCVFDITVAPDGAVYAAGSSGGARLYASRNHGDAWQTIHEIDEEEAFEAITVHPQDPHMVLVGGGGRGGAAGRRLLYSDNAGGRWHEMTDDLFEYAGPAAMAVDPNEGMLYVLLYAGSVYRRALSSLY
jgi:photosystem II stability/assembly factor-like uncharacterized protein